MRAAEERQAPSPTSPLHACSGQGGWRGRSARAAAKMACPGSRMSGAVLRSPRNLPGATRSPPLPSPRPCLHFHFLPPCRQPARLFAFCFLPASAVCLHRGFPRVNRYRRQRAVAGGSGGFVSQAHRRESARHWGSPRSRLFALCLAGWPAFWGRGASSWAWGFEGGFPGSLQGNVCCSFIKIQKGACPGLWLAFKTWGRLSPGQGKEKQEQEEQ